MSNKVYALPTRLSEPTHTNHPEFSLPLWAEFRKNPTLWYTKAKSVNHLSHSEGRVKLTAGDYSSCIAITTDTKKVITKAVKNLLEVSKWPEVYVLDGPSYALYSRMLMLILKNKIDLTAWKNRNRIDDGFYAMNSMDFHLTNYISSDPEQLSSDLEATIKHWKTEEHLKDGDYASFTLLSPYLPESLMLNFYGHISNKLEMYYTLGQNMHSVNLVDEFADECEQLASLYKGGCLSCTSNHDCLPSLSNLQVDYGFRISEKEVLKAAKKLSSIEEFYFAPLGAHRLLYQKSMFHMTLSSDVSLTGGIPKSTEQFLLTKKDPGALTRGISWYLELSDHKLAAKKFREAECSKCMLEPSCSILKINKVSRYDVTRIHRDCKGALTKESKRLGRTLMGIATKLALYRAPDSNQVDGFVKCIWDVASSQKLTDYARRSIGIITANEDYFYGTMVLPSSMVRFMEHSLDSNLPDSLMYDWNKPINRGKFVADVTPLVHSGIAGLEAFANYPIDDQWAVLLPTHKYFGRAGIELQSREDIPWYISISAEEFVTTYGDLLYTRVSTTSWKKDNYSRLLYLVRAFSDITLPKIITRTGSFGVNKTLEPGVNVHTHLPTNKRLKELTLTTTLVDLLLNYIHSFVEYSTIVSWPKAVVKDAFSIHGDY